MDAPYFPFYPYDWLADPNVQQLTLEEAGAYINLLSYMWVNGSGCTLPDDDRFLSRVLHVSPEKWKELREVLIDGSGAVFIRREDGLLHNKRLSIEYAKTTEKISKKVAAAQKRWSNADAMHMDSTSNAPAMQKQGYTDPDTDTDKRSVDDDVKRIVRDFEQAFSRLPNSLQLDDLKHYMSNGMQLDLVITAIKKSGRKGADPDYLFGILRKQFARGIRTLEQAEIDDSRRQASATGGVKYESQVSSGTSSGDGKRTRKFVDDSPGWDARKGVSMPEVPG